MIRLLVLILSIFVSIVFIMSFINVCKIYMEYRRNKKEILIIWKVVNECGNIHKDEIYDILSKNHLI